MDDAVIYHALADTEPEHDCNEVVVGSAEPLVLMVTDIVGFSSMVCELGDARAQQLVRVHNRVLRACIGEHAGREIAHTGDGFFVAFAAADAALECACSIQRAVARCRSVGLNLHVRIGLNAGRPLIEEDRLFGRAVNTAFRVCGAAQLDEVIVAQSALMVPSAPRWPMRRLRSASLKGIKDPVELYVLAWSGDAAAPAMGAATGSS